MKPNTNTFKQILKISDKLKRQLQYREHSCVIFEDWIAIKLTCKLISDHGIGNAMVIGAKSAIL